MPIDTTKFKDKVNYYDFFATKDGEECLPKTYYYTKYGAIAGSIFSFYEIVLISKPTTWHSTLGRFGHFTVPFATMGFAFGSSLCILAHLRKKDDTWNHFLAGAIAGSIWGFKYNKVTPGHKMAVFVGVVAAYWKFFHVKNLTIMNTRQPHQEEHLPQLDFHIKMYEDPGRPSLP